MISESFFPPESRSVLDHTWALSVFRVEDHAAQQRVLQALRGLGRADLTAMGTQRGDETFVVIDWDSLSDGGYAKQVVMAVDRHATVTYASERREVLP